MMLVLLYAYADLFNSDQDWTGNINPSAKELHRLMTEPQCSSWLKVSRHMLGYSFVHMYAARSRMKSKKPERSCQPNPI